MSYIERTARKLMPILIEIKKRMVPEKTIKDNIIKRSNALGGSKNKIETLDSVHDDVLTEHENNSVGEGQNESNTKR
jgi:hypothetical protein